MFANLRECRIIVAWFGETKRQDGGLRFANPPALGAIEEMFEIGFLLGVAAAIR